MRPSAAERLAQRRSITPGRDFLPLPEPVGAPPYRLHLERAGAVLSLHCVGDTGGWEDPEPQRRVVAAMADAPADLLYVLGDVVYPHGEADHYADQFDAAYAPLAGPIFAVPGNHDAENGLETGELALAPFLAHFGADTWRGPAQPHVHWTLVHDHVRIVGVWANRPEGGQLDSGQLCWLVGELRDCPAEVPLLLALHQPVFSADVTHGGNLALLDVLDAAAREAGRGPDAVLSGHAHLYARFTRRHGGRDVPCVVAGAGGFHQLHPLARGGGPLPARFDGLPGVTLDVAVDDIHGFLTITAGAAGAEAIYTAVAPGRPPAVVDLFAISPRSGPAGGKAATRSR